MPHKKARYRIKILAIMDSHSFYTSKMEIYAFKNHLDASTF